MTGGFWKGLLHGAVVGVIGLGALSLLNPRDTGEEATEKAAARDTAIPESQSQPSTMEPSEIEPADIPATVGPATEEKPVEQSETVATEAGATDPEVLPHAPESADRPQAATVDLPTGSEFGRGSDAAPQYPEALSRHSPEVRPVPLTRTPPADPSAPIMRDSADLRPDATLLPQSEQPEPETTPAPDLPESQSAPIGTEAPGLAGLEAPDQLPVPANSELTVNEVRRQDQPADTMSRENATPENATPALAEPSLDLSTPPDMSDLRALERE